MNFVLSIILLILCIYVGGKRGFKSYIVLFVDILFCILNIIFIGIGLNPVIITFLLSLQLIYIILYFANGYNKKTIASFYSSVIILVFLVIPILIATYLTKIQGFGYEMIEEIDWANMNLHLNFVLISVSSVIIGLVGSIVDTSTAVSTAVYEVYCNNKDITYEELLKSGKNVGTDVIATVTNTLFFAFLGSFLTLVIWFYKGNYDMTDILNNKILASELVAILFNAIGSCLIIPVTNYITCNILVKNNELSRRVEKKIKEYYSD